jgi:hypothetical protein
MSLINDALRRTSQTQAPPATPAATPPLQPVEPARRHAHLALVLAPVIILLLGLAGWFWVKWWESSIQMNQASNATRVAAREVPQGPDLTQTTSPGDVPAGRELIPRASTPNGLLPPRLNARPGPPSDPPARPGRPGPDRASRLVEPAEPTVQTNMASVPAAPPTFKLQGVFYRPTNPSAVINGKVVYIGDKVEQARVLAIEKDEVLIEYKGQRTVLNLP